MWWRCWHFTIELPLASARLTVKSWEHIWTIGREPLAGILAAGAGRDPTMGLVSRAPAICLNRLSIYRQEFSTVPSSNSVKAS